MVVRQVVRKASSQKRSNSKNISSVQSTNVRVNEVGNYEVIFPSGDGQISFGYHTTKKAL